MRLENRRNTGTEGAARGRSASGIRHLLLVGLIAAAFLVGCGGNPYADSFARDKPDRENLVGEWQGRFNPYARDFYGQEGRTTRLVLRADGSFEIHDRVRAPQNETYTSGHGSWSLQHVDIECPRWQVELHFPPDEVNGPGHAYFPLDILGNKPPYRLFQAIDDPDTGNAAIYSRSE